MWSVSLHEKVSGCLEEVSETKVAVNEQGRTIVQQSKSLLEVRGNCSRNHLLFTDLEKKSKAFDEKLSEL